MWVKENSPAKFPCEESNKKITDELLQERSEKDFCRSLVHPAAKGVRQKDFGKNSDEKSDKFKA